MTISLNKGAAPVSFAKQTGAILRLTLTWTSNTDVDLACMYEMMDGTKYCIQALDKRFGSLSKAPFVRLSGDDRRGGCEVLDVNLTRASEIRRLIPFAYIYSGGNWRRVGDAKVLIQLFKEGVVAEEYVIELDKKQSQSCALINLQNNGEGGLTMTRLAEFFAGTHRDIDRHYGWPRLNWGFGSKD